MSLSQTFRSLYDAIRWRDAMEEFEDYKVHHIKLVFYNNFTTKTNLKEKITIPLKLYKNHAIIENLKSYKKLLKYLTILKNTNIVNEKETNFAKFQFSDNFDNNVEEIQQNYMDYVKSYFYAKNEIKQYFDLGVRSQNSIVLLLRGKECVLKNVEDFKTLEYLIILSTSTLKNDYKLDESKYEELITLWCKEVIRYDVQNYNRQAERKKHTQKFNLCWSNCVSEILHFSELIQYCEKYDPQHNRMFQKNQQFEQKQDIQNALESDIEHDIENSISDNEKMDVFFKHFENDTEKSTLEIKSMSNSSDIPNSINFDITYDKELDQNIEKLSVKSEKDITSKEKTSVKPMRLPAVSQELNQDFDTTELNKLLIKILDNSNKNIPNQEKKFCDGFCRLFSILYHGGFLFFWQYLKGDSEENYELSLQKAGKVFYICFVPPLGVYVLIRHYSVVQFVSYILGYNQEVEVLVAIFMEFIQKYLNVSDLVTYYIVILMMPFFIGVFVVALVFITFWLFRNFQKYSEEFLKKIFDFFLNLLRHALIYYLASKKLFTFDSKNKNSNKTVWKDIDLPSGDRYIGMTKNELKDGFGTYYFRNGDIFKGSFVENVIQDEGLLIYSERNDQNYNVYLGEFSKDTFTGMAEMTYHGDIIYQGQFKENRYFGFGIYKNFDLMVRYKGMFFKDKKNGLAQLSDNDNENFYGFFSNNFRSGRGKLISENGEIFQGFFKDNAKDGEGELIYSDKTKYVGHFKKDKKHGEGIFTNTKGTKFKEIWHMGVRKSRSKLF